METITACFLVLDPPVDRFALLVNYIRPIVNEIVVVIDSRTDPEIVRKIETWQPIKTVQFDWIDDFAAARNAALPHVTSDWVLHLDPDELPSLAMAAQLFWVKDGNLPARTGGVLYWTVNFWDGEEGEEFEYHWHCRLFRAGRGKWYRRVHELVAIDGLEEPNTRETEIMPKASKEAYLIHSKPGHTLARDHALYDKIWEMT